MKKVKRKHIEYAEKVRLDKFTKYKKSTNNYILCRSKVNFDNLLKSSVEFKKANDLCVARYLKFYWGKYDE